MTAIFLEQRIFFSRAMASARRCFYAQRLRVGCNGNDGTTSLVLIFDFNLDLPGDDPAFSSITDTGSGGAFKLGRKRGIRLKYIRTRVRYTETGIFGPIVTSF